MGIADTHIKTALTGEEGKRKSLAQFKSCSHKCRFKKFFYLKLLLVVI